MKGVSIDPLIKTQTRLLCLEIISEELTLVLLFLGNILVGIIPFAFRRFSAEDIFVTLAVI